MLKLFITLQVAMLTVIASMEDRVVKTHRRDERGSVTIEQVIWAGAVIVIVAIVVAAIKAFVTSESAKIK
jgi:heme/copper-type cytochrome/quinol oxidase subunit 2